MVRSKSIANVARYADMFAAMGTESRLRIMRLLLSAHPEGMIAGDIGAELDIPPSTLPIIWTSSRTKTSSTCGAKAPSSGTR
jgi:hypothetical protein